MGRITVGELIEIINAYEKSLKSSHIDFVKIMIYSDGSGAIECIGMDTWEDKTILEFDNVDSAISFMGGIEILKSKDISPTNESWY